MAKADDLPLTSELPKKMMQRAQALLTELSDVRSQLVPLEERKKEIAEELESIQLSFEMDGFRHGNLAFYSLESKGRATLDAEALVAKGVPVATIKACTKIGKPYRVKNFAQRTERGWE